MEPISPAELLAIQWEVRGINDRLERLYEAERSRKKHFGDSLESELALKYEENALLVMKTALHDHIIWRGTRELNSTPK